MFESSKRFDNEDLCIVWKVIMRYKFLNNNIVKYELIVKGKGKVVLICYI